MIKLGSVVILILGFSNLSHAKLVEYNLNVSKKLVKISGKNVAGLSINDSIPGPTIKAKVGDILRIKVKNKLDSETSIHWHGVLVPNRMDGVPYINTPPIKSHCTFVYEFPVKHSGTYWYHAHSALQEQQGVYGSIIFYPEQKNNDYDEEHVVVLSDWTDEKPEQVLANIKKDSDYYALKKNSVQSWLNALENGSKAIKIKLNNAFNRMGPMDLSDIGYDAFLINGKQSINLSNANPGTKVKLRIINAAASSYFILEYSGGPMMVIESDGVKIAPFTAQRIRISMAETYDIIVTVQDNKTYEFRASAEDGTGFAVAHLGHGGLLPAPTLPKPNLALMDMGDMHDMGQMQMGGNPSVHSDSGMQMNQDSNPSKINSMSNMPMEYSSNQITNIKQKNNKTKESKIKSMDMMDMEHDPSNAKMQMEDNSASTQKMNMPPSNSYPKKLRHIDFLNNYKEIKSPTVTTLPKNRPSRSIELRLTGSMERYVWTINDTPMYTADKIVIKKGENVKITLVNETMMHHPIHLHGHFFRVLNGQGDYSPLKHTVNVAPFEKIEIEFEANEEKDWIFHCHNLYHMKLGMGGIIHYDGTEPDADLMDHNSEHSGEHGNHWFNLIQLEGYSNFANAAAAFMRNNDYIILDARYNYKKNYEIEVIYKRYTSQFFGFYVGNKLEKEDGKILNRGILGIEYVLPLLVKADLRVNTKGKFRFGLSNEHQITDRVSFDWALNTDKEYILNISYALTKSLYVSGNYDSRELFGIGLCFNF